MNQIKSLPVILIILAVFFTNDLISGQKQKVILDCDLGSDIDDAFALALVLTSPEFEVLGIVMDHGLTEKRAQIACKMLYETGMEHIPVVVGRQTPRVVGKDAGLASYRAQYYWAEGFSKVKAIKKSAADFIIEMLRKYPNEVILFTVGPVTNIGDIIKKDPEALKLAKHIYSMFGSFYLGYGSDPVPDAEWNVRGDVSSSKLFVDSGAPITYAGLDITTFIPAINPLSRICLASTPLDKSSLVNLSTSPAFPSITTLAN